MTEDRGPGEEEVRVGSAEDAAAHYRLAFENSPIGVLVTSFETGRYLEANPAECELLGYTRDEILSADPYEFWVKATHPEDFDEERAIVQRIVAGEINGYTVRKRFIRKNGEMRHGEFTVAVQRDARGRIRWAVTHTVDRTAEQRLIEAKAELEARLHQSQKLETVGRLVGGVAHDFNNRLLVIMGHAELLKRSAAGVAGLEAHADVVLSSARRAADLTRQLLAYGRMQILNSRPLDLNRIVDSLRGMLERLIGEDIELVTVLGAKQPALADPGQIEQVLLNLVLNARDAMPNGGRLTVETLDAELERDVAVRDLAPGGYAALSVTDTGVGIAEAAQTRLFEPFYTTKEVGKGTGLGLATVDGIARQSGGGVGVRSVEGRGSTFTVYLPRASDKVIEAPASERAPVAEVSGIETLLVVDDEDDVRRLLVDVLRLGAYQVLEARDGEHALEVLSRHPGNIDLLVTDTVMPRLSGPDLADRLRALQPDLKVLFMSGYAESERLRHLGKNERFIAKPFLPADLFVRVGEVLRAPAGKGIERAG